MGDYSSNAILLYSYMHAAFIVAQTGVWLQLMFA
jgi:hypothetical protein